MADKKQKCDIILPKNNNTARVFDIHFRALTNIALRVFVWDNLPPSLPQREIEIRLLLQGFDVVFNTDKYGIVTADGSIYGIDIYNHARYFTCTQPILGTKQGTIDLTGVCIYNTSIDSDITSGAAYRSVMRDLLGWYARMLTDIDVSITIMTLKSRATNGVMANSDAAKNALDKYYRDLERGDIYTPFAPTGGIFDNITDLIQHNVNNAVSVSDLVQLKSQIMRDFYAAFGVQSIQHKNERLITDEITNDTDFLTANIDDMLTCRQRGADDLNRIFGLNVTVGVNSYVSD